MHSFNTHGTLVNPILNARRPWKDIFSPTVTHG